MSATAVPEAVEPIPLPDMRRPDRTPLWPGWVASRVASMKDEFQKSKTDGKYRTIPTLPADLILNPAEQAEADHDAGQLEALCAQTPINGDQWEADTLVVITKLMLGPLAAPRPNETGAAATGQAYP